MPTNETPDVIIVGGGIGGSSLAAGLAQGGLAVVVLEREIEFVDRVRGEFILPWGVAETKKLGIYDTLMAAGGNHITKLINYDELMTPTEAEANAIPIGTFHPDTPGALCMQHVIMQNTLLQHASDCGVSVRRGVSDIAIEPGAAPKVSYTYEGAKHTHRCRLIVGADGRSSTVRRQLGLALDELEFDHLMSGLLVEGADDWPIDVQAIGKAGSIMYLVCPQGGGKLRLYADDVADRGRYSGEQGARNLLQAFNAECLRDGSEVADATPIGPCWAFPSQDSSLNDPFVDGAVLIGDAASYTDPIFGQGLSSTFRDVRVVRDLLLDTQRWSAATFHAYGQERNERIRRMIRISRFAGTLFARFDDNGIRTRARAMQRISNEPELGSMIMATYGGPETVPVEVFTDNFYARLFEPQWPGSSNDRRFTRC